MPTLRYIRYEHRLEQQYLPSIRALISRDLSEPYSIYVYRYFLYQWSHLPFRHVRFRVSYTDYLHICLMQALDPIDSSLVGVVICKLETHAANGPSTRRGYIAMLAVSAAHRGHGVATALVKMGIDAMAEQDADEMVLETEESNAPAIRLYERLGFFRSKKLHRYYLNGNSAYRLVLPLKPIDTDSALDLALEDEER
ncbi:hypothetical protein Sste5346_010465 [Sporothrix stenoceras]|uniref:N-acetyltransferase domain-containing protein n=1 Tax=Sporothrix stenoceras TaxID=5173 RepID=A0ABR3YGT7_9PEZI